MPRERSESGLVLRFQVTQDFFLESKSSFNLCMNVFHGLSEPGLAGRGLRLWIIIAELSPDWNSSELTTDSNKNISFKAEILLRMVGRSLV